MLRVFSLFACASALRARVASKKQTSTVLIPDSSLVSGQSLVPDSQVFLSSQHMPEDSSEPFAVLSGVMPGTCSVTNRSPKLGDLALKQADRYWPDPKCELSDTGATPASHCKYMQRHFCEAAMDAKSQDHFLYHCKAKGDTSLLFDQYGLEQTMLGKWMDSRQLCSHSDCASDASYVVVPSFLFHCFNANGGPNWDMVSNTTTHLDGHRTYWNRVREKFGGVGGGKALIVVHQSFTPDLKGTQAMFNALAEQPSDFIARVVIASLESNLKTEHKSLLNTVLQGSGPWADDASLGLEVHASRKRSPLLVTLPYPTDLMHETQFAVSTSSYNAERKRPVTVLMIAGARGLGSTLRSAIWDQMMSNGAVAPNPKSLSGCERLGPSCKLKGTPSIMLCANTSSYECEHHQWKSIYDVTANSVFCLQPAGDTLTRSHLYISILSGCVPVLFDPSERIDYNGTASTAWAFREMAGQKLTLEHEQLFLDYSTFSVIYPVAKQAPPEQFIGELASMATNDPARLQALRANLDKAIPWMRYAFEDCSENECQDAFTKFVKLLAHNKALLDRF